MKLSEAKKLREKKPKDYKLNPDMPHLRTKLDRIDRNRLQKIAEARDTRSFRKVIGMWAEDKLKTKILTDKQRMAIHLMCDMVNEYSNKYIATRLGINSSELTKWRNDPLFLRELDKEITRRRSFVRLHAYRNVNRAIMRGSMKDTWKYLQMTGDLIQKHEVVDRTGERELDDNELKEEIIRLSKQLEVANAPGEN